VQLVDLALVELASLIPVLRDSLLDLDFDRVA
jgi:hypothetical protein